ncbi:MAG: cupin domain-containing protein [Halieaceae bacterium]|jgi:quercetin dioxygenase-like cupin family protein|nr:cupin domain-containing protein [Halieaceae bacterium]
MTTAKNIIKLTATGLILVASFTAYPQEQSLGQYNKVLATASLESEGASDVAIREVYWPPGWKAPKHYHNSNLFIYVIEGEFEVTTEKDGIKRYTRGDTLRMQPATVMDARNISDTMPLKLVVFQVGKPGSPFSVPVE